MNWLEPVFLHTISCYTIFLFYGLYGWILFFVASAIFQLLLIPLFNIKSSARPKISVIVLFCIKIRLPRLFSRVSECIFLTSIVYGIHDDKSYKSRLNSPKTGCKNPLILIYIYYCWLHSLATTITTTTTAIISSGAEFGTIVQILCVSYIKEPLLLHLLGQL